MNPSMIGAIVGVVALVAIAGGVYYLYKKGKITLPWGTKKPTTTTVKNIKKVKISSATTINLLRIEFRDFAGVDHGANLTNLIATQSGTFVDNVLGSLGPEKIFDGNDTTFNNTLGTTNDWVQVEFIKPVQLALVNLWGRSGFQSRFSGLKIEFFLEDGTVFKTETIPTTSTSLQYTINFTQANYA